MHEVFVTGMIRSGTTLVQRLLHGAPRSHVAYQPFHQFHVDVKQRYLDEHGIRRVVPLGDGMGEPARELPDFWEWLADRPLDPDVVARIVARATTGPGGGAGDFRPTVPHGPATAMALRGHLMAQLAAHLDVGPEVMAWGAKEVLCEEYLEPLGRQGVRGILVVRDPRAVVASARHGEYPVRAGHRLPMLMLVRRWRRSVDFATAATDPRIVTIRFEDLVADPGEQLARAWHGVGPLPPPHDPTLGLRDPRGRAWRGNSSFGARIGVDKAAPEAWRTHLAPADVAFVEACTGPQMRALGYEPTVPERAAAATISGYREPLEGTHPRYAAAYRLTPARRREEVERIEAGGDHDGTHR